VRESIVLGHPFPKGEFWPVGGGNPSFRGTGLGGLLVVGSPWHGRRVPRPCAGPVIRGCPRKEVKRFVFSMWCSIVQVDRLPNPLPNGKPRRVSRW